MDAHENERHEVYFETNLFSGLYLFYNRNYQYKNGKTLSCETIL